VAEFLGILSFRLAGKKFFLVRGTLTRRWRRLHTYTAYTQRGLTLLIERLFIYGPRYLSAFKCFVLRAGTPPSGRYKLLSFISRHNRSSMNNKAEPRPLSHCVLERWGPESPESRESQKYMHNVLVHVHKRTHTHALARTIEAEVRIVSAFNKSRCSPCMHMLVHNNKANRIGSGIGSHRRGAINSIKLHLNVSDRLTMRGVSAIIDCKLNLTL